MVAVTEGRKNLELTLPPDQLIPSSSFALSSDPLFSDLDLFLSDLDLESAELSGTHFFQVLIRDLAVETTSSSELDFLKQFV